MALKSKERRELEASLTKSGDRKRYHKDSRKRIDRMVADMNRGKRIDGVIKRGEILYKVRTDETDTDYFYVIFTDENES